MACWCRHQHPYVLDFSLGRTLPVLSQVLASVAAKDENKAALAKAQAKKDAKKMRDDEPGEEASSLLGSLRRS